MDDPNDTPHTDTRYPGAPRWVKVIGAIILALILLAALLNLVGGDHGPRRHFGRSAVEAPAAVALAGSPGA